MQQLSTLGIFNFYYHLPDFCIQLWLLLCIATFSPQISLSLFRHLSALRAFFIGSVAGSDRAKLSFFPIHHQLGIYTENK